jgi:phosphoribosyl 1,2-cyclic phosphodiesterase
MKGVKLNLFGCRYAQRSVRDILSGAMVAPYFPVDFGQLQADVSSQDVCEETFEIGPISITPIPLSHPNQGMGYKFTEDGKSFVFLTDNELGLCHPGGREFADYLRFSEGADLLVHDAEYTEDQYRMTKGWGHSLYTDALRLSLEANARQFGLFHHNQERADSEQDRIVEDCCRLAEGEKSGLRCFALQAGMEITL